MKDSEEKEKVKEPEKFELDEKVLKRKSQYDMQGFMLVFARTGPYVVHSIYDKYVYKLRTDPVVTWKKVGYLCNLINSSKLEKYIDGEVLY